MKEATATLWASIVRTVVPLIVGQILGLLASWGIAGDLISEPLEAVLTLGLSALYYVAVRVLETHVKPQFGWLLGLPKAPVAYAKKS